MTRSIFSSTRVSPLGHFRRRDFFERVQLVEPIVRRAGSALTGPASLSKGNEVQGHVHCDNMFAQPPMSSDPSTYVGPTLGVSVDADFDAFDPI